MMAGAGHAGGSEGLEVRPFDLAAGLPAAQAMAASSWRRDYARQAYLDLFEERYWSLSFRSPGAFGRKPIGWGVWDGQRLVGFAGGVPRRVRVRDRSLDTYLVGWLTVDADHRRRGIATLLYRTAYEELHDAHDGGFMFLDKGHASTRVFDRLQRKRPTHHVVARAAVALRILREQDFWASTSTRWYERAYLRLRHRPFAPGPRPPQVRAYRPGDLTGCLALTRRITADLVREWDEVELGHHLAATDISHTLVLERGGVVRGFANYIVVRQMGLASCDVALVETVALGALAADESAALLRATLDDARERGCVSAIEFGRRYYPVSLLADVGFFFAPRELYLSYLVAREQLEGFLAESFYLDWR